MLGKFLKFFSSSALLALAQLLSAVLVARVEGAAVFGSFVLAQAVATPIAMFFNFGLRQFFSTDAHRAHSWSTALRLKSWASVAAIAAGLGAVLAAPTYFSGWAALFLLFLLYKTIEGATEIQVGILQREGSFNIIARILTTKSAVYLLAFLLGELVFGSVLVSIAFAATGLVGILLSTHFFLLRKSSGAEPGNALEMFKSAFPLGLAALAVALNLNLPRAIIEDIGPISLFAYFAASLQIAAPLVLALNIVCQFFLPSLSAMFAKGETNGFRKMAALGLITVIVGALCVFVVFSWIGGDVVRLVYGFEDVVPPRASMSVAFYVAVTLLLGYSNYVLMSTRSFRVQVAAAATAAAGIAGVGVAAFAAQLDFEQVIIAIGLVMILQALYLVTFSVFSATPREMAGHA